MPITANYTACSVSNLDEMGQPGSWFLRRGTPGPVFTKPPLFQGTLK